MMNYEDEYLQFDIRRDSVHEDSCGEDEADSTTQKTTDRDQLETTQNSPFYLHWIFGHDSNIPILNLTKSSDSDELAFGASQVGTIYNHNWKRCSYLMGHEFQLNTIKCDGSGRFMVTADQCCVKFWDRDGNTQSNDPILIHSIGNAYETSRLVACGFSNDGKYVVTVDNENLLKFWLWSFGRDECDGCVQIQHKLEGLRNIKFSKNRYEKEWFVITFRNGLVFGHWNLETNNLVINYPVMENTLKNVNDSTYIQNSRQIVSVTEKGQAILWSDCVKESKKPKMVSNAKELTKIIPIQNFAIKVVENVDNVLVFGDTNGDIKFYDNNIMFLYWLQAIKFDPIVSISFNLNPRNFRIEDQKIYSGRFREWEYELW